MSFMHRFLILRRGTRRISNFKIQMIDNNGSNFISNKNINNTMSYSRLRFINYSNYQGLEKACLFLGHEKDYTIQKRGYAKGKSKGGEKGAAHSHITEEELGGVINVESFKKDLKRIIENLQEDYLSNLTLRSNVGSLETLLVELEGDKYPLSEIAQVIRKSPTLVIINATAFPQASPNIKKAIEESGMGLNPQQDGTTFFIPIPKITKEHREKLAQGAKTMCEKRKIQLKDTQNKLIKKVQAKDGTISKDLIFNAQLKIRDMTQESINKVEELMKNKQNELLKVTK
ncbi:UNVERIFIED_CONTAM: hypothetical protein RMT77_016196 [Armadillidium vulgare]